MSNIIIDSIISYIFNRLKNSGIIKKSELKTLNLLEKEINESKTLNKEISQLLAKVVEHDAGLIKNNSSLVNNLRGIIRPICTLFAFAWYLYAKVNNIELSLEDYSIIGGILAFWFGFRTYEKSKV